MQTISSLTWLFPLTSSSSLLNKSYESPKPPFFWILISPFISIILMRLSYFDRIFIKGVVVRWPSNWSAIRHIGKGNISIYIYIYNPPASLFKSRFIEFVPKKLLLLVLSIIVPPRGYTKQLINAKGFFPFLSAKVGWEKGKKRAEALVALLVTRYLHANGRTEEELEYTDPMQKN